jgi:hypothetical protein
MGVLIWLFGSREVVSYVGRASIRTTIQGVITAFGAVSLATAGGLGIAWAAAVFAVVAIVPAVLTVAMQAIEVSREPSS